MLAKKLFFLSLLFLFSISASAETLSGNYIISYYQDAPAERTLTLQNSATAKEFSLDIIGEKIPWTFVTPTKETIKGFCASSQDIVLCAAPSEFSLAANAEREVYFFSKAKTFAKSGDYFVDVFANGASLGTFTITVQDGHSLAIESENAEQIAGQCEAKTFAITVSNNGKFDEEAALSVSGIPSEWISISDQSFVLSQGASKTANITVQAPCGQELKAYSFSATVSSPKANVSATKKLSLTIQNLQGFSISDIEGAAGNSIDACNETETTKTIKVTNNGRIADEIELSLKAPAWVTISSSKLSVEPKASKTITITAGKTDAAQKQYPAEITAKSAKFGNLATKEIAINLEDCYNAVIEKVSGPEKACLNDNPQMGFDISNDRNMEISLDIKISGVSAKLDKKTVTIASGESETATATLDLSNEAAGTKELLLEVGGTNFSASKKFGIEAVKCGIEIETEKKIVDVNTVVGTLTRVIVSNKTLTSENIKVEVRGKDWILFNPKEFMLKAGENKEVFMYVSPPFNAENALQKANITARSENYVATAAIDLNVFGGIEIGTADVIVNGIEVRSIGSLKEIKTRISLKNDSNVSITIMDVNSETYDTKYYLKNNMIKPNDSSPMELTILLPAGSDGNKFSVPLDIMTEQGTFRRFAVIDLYPAKPSDGNATQTIPVGMPFFAQPKNIILIAVIIVLIALVAYLTMKKNGNEKAEKKEETSAYSIAEQVKAKPKRKRKAKKKGK